MRMLSRRVALAAMNSDSSFSTLVAVSICPPVISGMMEMKMDVGQDISTLGSRTYIRSFSQHSGTIQGTFRDHSGNIQGTFSLR
jgi:hypothetical protein